MTHPYPDSRNWKSVARLAPLGIAVAVVILSLERAAAPGGQLLKETGWVAIEVLRPLLLVGWHSVSPYLRENASILQNLLQIVASNWPLLCVLAG
jgi:hypothetical protein